MTAAGLSLRHVSKSYAGTRALDGVSLDLAPGEVHALMGENGAGKSTLIRVLAGVTPADSLTATLDGHPVALASPAEADALGLRFVHQELNIVPALSVAENILLGHPTPRRFGLAVDWARMHRLAAGALSRLGVTGIDPRARAAHLATGEQMLMVLAGLLVSTGPAPRVFVLDEPTASLTHAESDRLFAVLRDLRASGAAILYVSHRIDEVIALADRVTVLRDGRTVASAPIAGIGRADLIRAMTGREVRDTAPHRPAPAPATPLCTVEALDLATATGLGFRLHPGEILGVTGLEHAGQSEVLRALLGDARPRAGRIRLGTAPGPASPHDAWRRGIAYVPRERRREGLAPGRSITANVTLPHLDAHARWGLLSRPALERRTAGDLAARVRLRFSRLGQPVRTLSGGNQQKVLFARAIAGNPDILLLDEPTRGVDIGARADLHDLIHDFTASGGAVVLTTTDLPELLGLCDRILVLRDGRQACTVATDGLDPAGLLALIYGDAAPPKARP